MSTNDVPGAKVENNDVLAMGCWAEYEDGSLILVESVEAGNVVYSLFDMNPEPPVEYRDSMLETDFKRQFSWNPRIKTSPSNIKWTWHDKTPFPWDEVMKNFPSGQKHPSAESQMSAARRVAESLHLRADKVRERQFGRPTSQRPARSIMERIRNAVEALTE